MLGSAAKRMAMLKWRSGDGRIIKSIERMYSGFEMGWSLQRDGWSEKAGLPDFSPADILKTENTPDHYAYPNFMAVVLIAPWYSKADDYTALDKELQDSFRAYLLANTQELQRPSDFWRAISKTDALLLALISTNIRKVLSKPEIAVLFPTIGLKGNSGSSQVSEALDELMNGIIEILKRETERFGSQPQLGSVYDHVHFLKLAVENEKHLSKNKEEILFHLNRLLEEIEKLSQ